MNSLRRVTHFVCALGILAECHGSGDSAPVAPVMHPLTVTIFAGRQTASAQSMWILNDPAVLFCGPDGVCHSPNCPPGF